MKSCPLPKKIGPEIKGLKGNFPRFYLDLKFDILTLNQEKSQKLS